MTGKIKMADLLRFFAFTSLNLHCGREKLPKFLYFFTDIITSSRTSSIMATGYCRMCPCLQFIT